MEINIQKDKSYRICTCAKSQKLPFCDGSHKGTEYKSLPFKAESDGIVKISKAQNKD